MTGGHGGSSLSVLRLFRLVRIVKIIRFMPVLQRQLLVMFNTIDHVATFFFLLAFFLFVFALLGMSLFGCKFCTSPSKMDFPIEILENSSNFIKKTPVGKCNYQVLSDESLPSTDDNGFSLDEMDTLIAHLTECPLENFDTIEQAIFTVLQIFTQDDWSSVMKDGMLSTSDTAALYFISLVTLGNYLIFNLLVAILVEGFSAKTEEAIVNAALKVEKRQQASTSLQVPSIQRLAMSPKASFEKQQNEVEKPRFYKLTRCFHRMKHRFVLFCNGGSNHQDKNYSLLLIPSDSNIRLLLANLFKTTIYDKCLVVCVSLHCLVIVGETSNWEIGDFPLDPVWTVANYTLTVIFTLEALLKVICYGLIIGKEAYLKNMGNVVDFFLVFIACVDIFIDIFGDQIENETVHQIINFLCLFRALRPIRVVSKTKQLQVVLKTLIQSVKPIGNISEF